MTLKAQINDDLKAALLGGDHFRVGVLRGLKAVILDEEVAKGKREQGLEEEVIEQLITREVKKRKESAEIFKDASRPELADNELAEAKIISEYLPEQLSEDKINEVIKRVISELQATNMSSMGQVIGSVKKELGNSADGALIAKLVKVALS